MSNLGRKAVVVLLLEDYDFDKEDVPLVEWEWDECIRTQNRMFDAIGSVRPLLSFTDNNLVQFIEFMANVMEGGENNETQT